MFLDCDGVLAAFDTAAEQIFNHNPRHAEAALGTEVFWSRLRGHSDFYGSLPVMADAMQLYDAVAHLDPIILTGCPTGGWSERQKINWANRHFPGSGSLPADPEISETISGIREMSLSMTI
jgi:hypothetical protein